MRIIFLGTPDFGVPALKRIIADGHNVIAVVCQPDKAGSRGKTEFCPVKKCALEYGIEVLQFEKISRDGLEILKELAPDIMVTAAYGQILSQAVIDVAPYGIINIHGSLLPALRGAAPIQYAVLKGEKVTGITILKTVYKVDAGDILLQKSLEIGKNENSGELFVRMSDLGAEALSEALSLIKSGKAVFTPQEESLATFSQKITVDSEEIDWNGSAESIRNLIRALAPSPSAWTLLNGKRLKIFSACNTENNAVNASAGTVLESPKGTLYVACGNGRVLSISELQAENGKKMKIKDFLNGNKITVGSVLGR